MTVHRAVQTGLVIVAAGRLGYVLLTCLQGQGQIRIELAPYSYDIHWCWNRRRIR